MVNPVEGAAGKGDIPKEQPKLEETPSKATDVTGVAGKVFPRVGSSKQQGRVKKDKFTKTGEKESQGKAPGIAAKVVSKGIVNSAVDLVSTYLANEKSPEVTDLVFEELKESGSEEEKKSFAIGVITHACNVGKTEEVLELIKKIFPNNEELIDLVSTVKQHSQGFRHVLAELKSQTE